jgi:major vault protein
VLKKEPQ